MCAMNVNFLSPALLNATLRNTAYSSPATVYTALYTTLPANDQWTLALTGNPTGGTFTLTFGGQTTANINWNDTAATVQTRLTALSSIGSGNVVVTGINGQYDGALPGDTLLISFTGTLGLTANGNITSTDSTTGGTHAISLTHTVTGSAGVEPSAGSYARVATTFAAPAGNTTQNSATVTFPTSTSSGYSASPIVGWGVCDALTSGHVLYYDVFAGTNDQWTVNYTFSTAPTGGSLTLTLTGTSGNEIGTTSAIPWNTDALTLQGILEEMAGQGNVSVRSVAGQASGFVMPNVTSGSGGLLITFQGALRYAAQTLAVGTSSLTGGSGSPTATVAHTTTGASGNQTINASNESPSFASGALVIQMGP